MVCAPSKTRTMMALQARVTCCRHEKGLFCQSCATECTVQRRILGAVACLLLFSIRLSACHGGKRQGTGSTSGTLQCYLNEIPLVLVKLNVAFAVAEEDGIDMEQELLKRIHSSMLVDLVHKDNSFHFNLAQILSKTH